MGSSVENQRPVQRKAPYVLHVIQVMRCVMAGWEDFVEGGEGGDMVVDWDAVVGHLIRRGF